MEVLVAGLVLFLGVHSLRVVADGWRSAQIARRGEAVWKGAYSLLSLAGLLLVIWGYGMARQQPVLLWPPSPLWLRGVAAVLMLPSFVLLAAAYVPRNGIKAQSRHPMLLGVKVWALAHLLVNNTLADLLLFGAFLAWAVAAFAAARRRDRAAAEDSAVASRNGTWIALAAGVLAWAVFAFWAHGWLFGVSPLG